MDVGRHSGGRRPAAGVPRQRGGEFARICGVDSATAFLARPDGYLSARLYPPSAQDLATHLDSVFRTPEASPTAPRS